ncbi:MAG: signal peptidase I [Lachnospiraceae bacterium]|nr:signal peptidase I [Lachnospiraceae bacterium]
MRNSIIELCVYIAIIVICVAFVPKYVLQRTIVDGKSMMNTLKNGENLLVEKVSYHFTDPDRFDVIVFYPHGRDSKDYFIKRVIGLPGETVQIKGADIYINGEKIEENFGKDPITDPGIAEKPIKLGDDEFFVLGDNRTVSDDSRYEDVGPVKRENIEGRAILRIYPLSEFGTFE